MDVAAALRTWDSNLRAHARAIAAKAVSCGSDWDALLAHYGLSPDEDARAEMTGAAPPEEVEAALKVVASWARGELERIARKSGSGADAALVLERDRSLPAFIRTELNRYLAAAAPTSLSPPFEADSSPHSPVEIAGLPWGAADSKPRISIVTCSHCSAAQEEPGDGVCRYCRRPLRA